MMKMIAYLLNQQYKDLCPKKAWPAVKDSMLTLWYAVNYFNTGLVLMRIFRFFSCQLVTVQRTLLKK